MVSLYYPCITRNSTLHDNFTSWVLQAFRFWVVNLVLPLIKASRLPIYLVQVFA